MNLKADQQLEDLRRVAERNLIDSLNAMTEALNEAGLTTSLLNELVTKAEEKDKAKRTRNETWYDQQQSEQQRRFRRY